MEIVRTSSETLERRMRIRTRFRMRIETGSKGRQAVVQSGQRRIGCFLEGRCSCRRTAEVVSVRRPNWCSLWMWQGGGYDAFGVFVRSGRTSETLFQQGFNQEPVAVFVQPHSRLVGVRSDVDASKRAILHQRAQSAVVVDGPGVVDPDPNVGQDETGGHRFAVENRT